MANGREDQGSKRAATERAEELLNRVGWTAGLFASMLGMHLARVAAFAREEAEDMWAEARNIHQQRQHAEDNGERVTTREGTDVSERKAAEEHRAEPEHGTETDRTIMAGDYVGAAGRKEETPAVSERDAEPQGEESIKATPLARRHAEELGVNLREVEGTGAGGQITVQDVKKKAGSKE